MSQSRVSPKKNESSTSLVECIYAIMLREKQVVFYPTNNTPDNSVVYSQIQSTLTLCL